MPVSLVLLSVLMLGRAERSAEGGVGAFAIGVVFVGALGELCSWAFRHLAAWMRPSPIPPRLGIHTAILLPTLALFIRKASSR